MDKNINIPPIGENSQENIEKEKKRLADFLHGYDLSEEEIHLLTGSKDDVERQQDIDMFKKHNISEFEANLLIDLCWNNLENREWIEKEKILNLLKEKGFNDETRSFVINWKMEQKILVFKENTSKASILLSLEMVDFYAFANNLEEVFAYLKDIHKQLIYDTSLTQGDKKEISEKLFAKIFSSAEIVQQLNIKEFDQEAERRDYTELFKKIDGFKLN